MNVVLYDIDSKIPNLALMKLSSFYRSLGYHTQLSKKTEWIDAQRYFASVVFNSERSLREVEALVTMYGDKITVGGVGVQRQLTCPVGD